MEVGVGNYTVFGVCFEVTEFVRDCVDYVGLVGDYFESFLEESDTCFYLLLNEIYLFLGDSFTVQD